LRRPERGSELRLGDTHVLASKRAPGSGVVNRAPHPYLSGAMIMSPQQPGGVSLPNWSTPPGGRPPFAFLSAVRASGLPDGVGSEGAATAVFCALEQRLPPALGTRFQAMLPEELRELFRRCGPTHALPADGFGKDEFMRRVGEHLAIAPADAEEVTRSVFVALQQTLPSRDAGVALARLLPADLTALWDDDDAIAAAGAGASLPVP
jgi:uncharacterized protein (DUF2267 family)